MATSFLGTSHNLSLYCIPAGWVLSIIPHFYAASLGKFDNRSPRNYTTSIESDQTIDNATKARIVRAEGAQQNGFENIGLFAAAVVAGNIARLDNSVLNSLSVGYLASRVVYNFIYINNTTNTTANLRTASFLTGLGLIFTLFIKSGIALNKSL